LNLWHDYDKLKRIGHLVAQIGAAWLLKEVESGVPPRQAEAYRTFG